MTSEQVNICCEYVWQVLLQCIDLKGEWTDYITYADEKKPCEKKSIRIKPSGFFRDPQNIDGFWEWSKVDGLPVIIATGSSDEMQLSSSPYPDIIASAFFLLTRYEEILRRDERDEHGRFPGRQSLPYREGFIDRPVVDEYGRLLQEWFVNAGVDTPNDKSVFRVCLTHDVDELRFYSSLRGCVGHAIRKRSVTNPLRMAEPIASYLGLKRDPYDTFDQILDWDLGLRDALGNDRVDIIFFFLAGGHGPNDGMYDIRSWRTRRLIRKIVATGGTIGLHVSYQAGGDPELIAGEKRALEDVCGFEITRSRHHFLSLREPEDTWSLAEAGITDDYSLGYADIAGFRTGTCRPFPMFDSIRMKTIPVNAHPLVAMDVTMSNANYMDLQEPDAKRAVLKLASNARRVGGEFVLLWHNSNIGESDEEGYHSTLYPELLKTLAVQEEDARRVTRGVTEI